MRNFQSIFERNYLETRNFSIILALQILCHKLQVPEILKSELRVRTQIKDTLNILERIDEHRE